MRATLCTLCITLFAVIHIVFLKIKKKWGSGDAPL